MKYKLLLDHHDFGLLIQVLNGSVVFEAVKLKSMKTGALIFNHIILILQEKFRRRLYSLNITKPVKLSLSYVEMRVLVDFMKLLPTNHSIELTDMCRRILSQLHPHSL